MQVDIIKVQSGKNKSKTLIAKFLLSPEVGVLIPLIILSVFTALNNANFLTSRNINSIFRLLTYVAIIAIGQAICIIVAEIDLSLGALAGFSSMVFGYVLVIKEQNIIVSIIATLLVGLVIGLINGYFVAYFGLVNFITTLATMFICIGLSNFITNGMPIFPLPDYVAKFGAASPMGLSWAFFLMLALYIIMEIVMRFTIIGRKIYSVGDNKEATYLSGINSKAVKLGAYVLSGVLASICGILVTLEASASQPSTGPGWEFKTIAACAVGGISLAGGAGSMIGVAIGVILISVLENCLVILAVDSNWQTVVTGIVLVGAVLLDTLKRKSLSKKA